MKDRVGELLDISQLDVWYRESLSFDVIKSRISHLKPLKIGVILSVFIIFAALKVIGNDEVIGGQMQSEVAVARQVMSQRKAQADTLKAQLDAATTPDQKRQTIEAYRVEAKSLIEQRQISSTQGKSPSATIAEMKVRAQGDSEALQRISKLEQRLKDSEKLKTRLAAFENVSPEQKEALLEEFQKERKKISEQRIQEAQTSETVPNQINRPDNLPPEMQAMVAKQELRRQEVAALKETLKTAGTEERQKLISDWQKKRQQEEVKQP